MQGEEKRKKKEGKREGKKKLREEWRRWKRAQRHRGPTVAAHARSVAGRRPSEGIQNQNCPCVRCIRRARTVLAPVRAPRRRWPRQRHGCRRRRLLWTRLALRAVSPRYVHCEVELCRVWFIALLMCSIICAEDWRLAAYWRKQRGSPRDGSRDRCSKLPWPPCVLCGHRRAAAS